MNALKSLAERTKYRLFGDILRRNPFFYTSAMRVFDRLATASLEERREFTKGRLRKVLKAALRTDYGRQAGADYNIASWRLLGKPEVRDNPMAFVSGPAWFSSPASTGGTTGLPLKLFRSFQSMTVEQASIDRLIIANGLNPRTDRIAVLRGDNVKDPADKEPPFWKFASGGRRMVMSSNHLNRTTVDVFYEALLDFRPQCMMAYPTSLETLGRLLQERGRTLEIPLIVTSSETVTPVTRQLAKDVLGAKLTDHYGQAERAAFAYSFKEGEYWFLPGYAYVELLPSGEEDENTMLYEIVGTNLWNMRMPLVRYRTDDLIRVPKGLSDAQIEAICYGAEPFAGVLGRTEEYLVSPDGAHLTGVNQIPRGVDNVMRMQVIQESLYLVRILVLTSPGFSERDRQQIMHNARLKIPPEMEVELEVVDELVSTAQNKKPFVIRKFEQPTGGAQNN